MGESVPRIHHLLPQFYVRAVANTRGQVRVVERDGRTFNAKTSKVFAERDYYTVSSEDAGEDPALIEGLYSEIEAVTAPIFARLVGGEFPLPGRERSEFASFRPVPALARARRRQQLRRA